jgi:hypothetical protein
LHTMGTEMIAEDVKKFVKNRGSSLWFFITGLMLL